MKIVTCCFALCVFLSGHVRSVLAQEVLEMGTESYNPPIEEPLLQWRELTSVGRDDTPPSVLLQWNFSYADMYVNGGVPLTLFKRKYVLKHAYLAGPYNEQAKSYRPLAYAELYDISGSTANIVSAWPVMPLDGADHSYTLNLPNAKIVNVSISGWSNISFQANGTNSVNIAYQQLHSAWLNDSQKYCKDYISTGTVSCLVPQGVYADGKWVYGFVANPLAPLDSITGWPADYVDCAKREGEYRFRPKAYSLPLNFTFGFSSPWVWWLHDMTKLEWITAEYEQHFSGIPTGFQ